MFHSISSPDNLIFDFNKDIFTDLFSLTENFQNTDKDQINYLFRYLSNPNINCKTIVLEERYVDKYYLDDFTHFYATCHRNYPKNCRRLHFFKIPLKKSDLFSSEHTIKEKLQKNYLGFIVVKPLEPIVIGRTLLIPYDDSNLDIFHGNELQTRHILTIRFSSSNLFGKNLTVRSIPFQEQDSVVAACATSALWTVLEKTSKEFGYYTPTPYEIKNTAHKYHTIYRPLPSSGLNIIQIINAIREFGMEVEVIDFENVPANNDNFLSMCYAYLRGGFPIFLGVEWGKSNYHALALVGYNLSNEKPQIDPNHLSLLGNRIQKLYVHDDNIGPFSRYSIISNSQICLNCEDRVDDNRNLIEIHPFFMVIPIYHKIRYPFSKIKDSLFEIIEVIQTLDLINDNDLWEWDCYISTVNQLKSDLVDDLFFQNLPDTLKESILLGFYPRFIWRSILLYDHVPLMEIWADATEAKTQIPFFRVLFYHNVLKDAVHEIFTNKNYRDLFTPALWDRIHNLFEGIIKDRDGI